MQQSCRFPKHCILRKKNEFKTLMEKGKTIKVFPFYVKYLFIEKKSTTKIKAAFTIRKKDFKKANKRNYLKRITKEVYRKNKYLLENSEFDKQLILLLIYNTNTFLNYKSIETGLVKLLQQLSLKNK